MNSKNPVVIKRNNQKRVAIFRRIKGELIAYKGGKCAHCGIVANEGNHCIFDFHHINPREKEGKLQHSSLAVAKKEADKTILLCSNCHKLLHYRMGGTRNARSKKEIPTTTTTTKKEDYTILYNSIFGKENSKEVISFG